MSSRYSPRSVLIAVLAAGLLVRIIFLTVYWDNPRFTNDDDSREYLVLAENIKAGNGFSQSKEAPFISDSFRTPGYPYFLYTTKSIFGVYQSALVIQILISVFIAYLIYALANKLDRAWFGVLAAGMFLFAPFSILVSLRYLTQTLFTGLLMTAVYLWVCFLDSQKKKFIFLTALAIALAAYVRPIGQWLPWPFILAYFLSFRGKIISKLNLKQTLKAGVILGLSFEIILLPWLYRNYLNFGEFALSSVQSYQLYFYDTPAVLAHNRHISYEAAREILDKEIARLAPVDHFSAYTSFTYGDILTQRAVHYLTEDLGSLFLIRSKLVFNFFTRDGIRYWFEYWAENGSDLRKRVSLNDFLHRQVPLRQTLFAYSFVFERLCLLIISLGLILAFLNKKNKTRLQQASSLLFLLIILYFAILSGAVSSAGLRYPAEPLIWLLGLAGLKEAFSS